MIKSNGTKITMNYGDYGVSLPINITNIELEKDDYIMIKIGKPFHDILVEKKIINLSEDENTFTGVLDFTKNESEKLKIGDYDYYLEHYRNEELKDTLVISRLIVDDGV